MREGVFNVSKNWYWANQSGSWNQNGKKKKTLGAPPN